VNDPLDDHDSLVVVDIVEDAMAAVVLDHAGTP
jgi:hypothetical protein